MGVQSFTNFIWNISSKRQYLMKYKNKINFWLVLNVMRSAAVLVDVITSTTIKHESFKEFFFWNACILKRRSQWPRGLRRRSSAAGVLGSWARIPPGAWMFECCVLSGRGLCDGLITHPEESYRLWRVVCDQETSKTRKLKTATGLWKIQSKWVVTPGKQTNMYSEVKIWINILLLLASVLLWTLKGRCR